MIENIVYAILIVMLILLSIGFSLALIFYSVMALLGILALGALWVPLAIGFQYGWGWSVTGVPLGLILSWMGISSLNAYMTSQASQPSH